MAIHPWTACFAVSLCQLMPIAAWRLAADTSAAQYAQTYRYYRVALTDGTRNNPHLRKLEFYWDGQWQPWTAATRAESPNFVVGGKPVVVRASKPVAESYFAVLTSGATYWSFGSGTPNIPCWITFDFGENPPPISDMRFRAYDANWCFDSYSIEASDDGNNWAYLVPITTTGIVCDQNSYSSVQLPEPATPPASATGDPHMQNIHGERFDLMKPGKHVLINIPRGIGASGARLRVQADAVQLGNNCGDLYFQTLNVTGSWAETKQPGGYHFSVSQSDAAPSNWIEFGKVALKIVIAHSSKDFRYVNLHAKHLGQSGHAVGGLLGEDDHEEASAPPGACVKRVSLQKGAASAFQTPPIGSVAEANLV